MPSPEEQVKLDEMRNKVMERQGDVETSEDGVYAEASPKGEFHKKALNSLVAATNQLLPLFGITEKYDSFEGDLTELPVDFTRLLTMFGAMINDAIGDDILTEDTAIDLSSITNDSGLLATAGRIGIAAKNTKLKKWLKRKSTETVSPETETVSTETVSPETPEGSDALFAGRM